MVLVRSFGYTDISAAAVHIIMIIEIIISKMLPTNNSVASCISINNEYIFLVEVLCGQQTKYTKRLRKSARELHDAVCARDEFLTCNQKVLDYFY